MHRKKVTVSRGTFGFRVASLVPKKKSMFLDTRNNSIPADREIQGFTVQVMGNDSAGSALSLLASTYRILTDDQPRFPPSQSTYVLVVDDRHPEYFEDVRVPYEVELGLKHCLSLSAGAHL